MATFAILGWAFIACMLYRARKIQMVCNFYRGALDIIKSVIYMKDMTEQRHYNDDYYKGVMVAFIALCLVGILLMVFLIGCSLAILFG